MASVNQPVPESVTIFATTSEVSFYAPSVLPSNIMGGGVSTVALPAGTYVFTQTPIVLDKSYVQHDCYVLENRNLKARIHSYQLRELTPLEALAATDR